MALDASRLICQGRAPRNLTISQYICYLPSKWKWTRLSIPSFVTYLVRYLVTYILFYTNGKSSYRAGSWAIRFLSVLAGRLRRSRSMASIFNLTTLPRKENGFLGLASRNRSQRRQNCLLLAPRISKPIYSKSTVLSIRQERGSR
jgi:hypothetical protein